MTTELRLLGERDVAPLSEVQPVTVRRICRESAEEQPDSVAVEEPLEIRLVFHQDGKPVQRAVSVTMRTPGHDDELAAGFFFTEGIVADSGQIASIRKCGAGNVVRVELRSDAPVDFDRLERHFFTASSCGVCGKTSIAAVHVDPRFRPPPDRPVIAAKILCRLPDALRQAQTVFDRTGGLHAAALFDSVGRLLSLREDVGRHNALDKLIGRRVLDGRTPLSDVILLVSGRASFELVQKAAVAGIPVLAAVGAPSSLAVELARHHGMTLAGFVRDGRCNVYAGDVRICD